MFPLDHQAAQHFIFNGCSGRFKVVIEFPDDRFNAQYWPDIITVRCLNLILDSVYLTIVGIILVWINQFKIVKRSDFMDNFTRKWMA